MNRTLVLTAALLGTASGMQANPVVVQPSHSTIVLPADLREQPARDQTRLRQVAGDLAEHLERVTGVAIPIASDAPPPVGRFVFHVAVPPPDDAEPLAIGEARWRVTDAGAWLYGNDDRGELGSLVAVYDFLERQLGIRWLEPGEQGRVVPKQNPLTLTAGSHQWAPSLMSRRIRRGIQVRPVPDTPESDVRRQQAVANNRRVDEINVWSRRMRMGGQNPAASHAFSDWWPRFGETHPDFFALNRHGERAPVPGARRAESWIKICPSNPAVAEQLVADWLPRKEQRWFVSAGINDGQTGFCECADCRALDVTLEDESWDRHLTDRYVVLANRVARRVREHREDAHVSMYAYMRTLAPPRRERLEPNIIVTVVPYVDPLDSDVVREHFGGWREKGATKFVLRPNYHHKYHNMPFPIGMEEQFFDVFQTAYALGVISANYDMLMDHWTAFGFSDYVLARAMSEPDQPFANWEDHYCAGFGPAAGDVKAFYRYWREEVWQRRLKPNFERLLSRSPGGDFSWGLMRALINFHHPDWQPEGCDHYYETADFDRTDAILRRALEREKLGDTERHLLTQKALTNRHARLLFNALSATDDEKRAHAEALRDFRNAHAGRLSFRWGHVGWFERRRLRNAAGLEIAYDDADGNRLPHPQWHLVTDKE